MTSIRPSNELGASQTVRVRECADARTGDTCTNTCQQCCEFYGSVAGVKELLSGKWQGCEDCPRAKTISVMVRQYQMRLPRWWVVDGAVVVPIWIVECVQKGNYKL